MLKHVQSHYSDDLLDTFQSSRGDKKQGYRKVRVADSDDEDDDDDKVPKESRADAWCGDLESHETSGNTYRPLPLEVFFSTLINL